MTTHAPTRPAAGRLLVLAASAAAVLAAGCATAGSTAGGAAAGVQEAGGRRSARLIARTTPAVSGTAVLEAGDEPGQMVVRVFLETSPSNAGVHAWRMVRGSCGVSSGTIVGSAAYYPVIRIEANGRGEGTATVPLQDYTGTLSVRILASPTNSSLVACGDLR
jgi:hypothetical protein